MECSICNNYNDFYKILASSTLTILSITWAIKIYMDRSRMDEVGKVDVKINNLKILIYEFIRLVLKARTSNLSRTVQISIEEFSQKYNDTENPITGKEVLRFINTLQFGIYENFMDKTAKYKEKIQEDREKIEYIIDNIPMDQDDANREYEIDTLNFKNWLEDVSNDLKEAQETYNYLNKVIIDIKHHWHIYTEEDVYQENLKDFYERYWDILLDIRDKALRIKEEIEVNNKKWYVWDPNSKSSNRYLRWGFYLLMYSGFFLPLYMIQPNKFGILRCEEFFWVTLIALGISGILIYKAYRTRNNST